MKIIYLLSCLFMAMIASGCDGDNYLGREGDVPSTNELISETNFLSSSSSAIQYVSSSSFSTLSASEVASVSSLVPSITHPVFVNYDALDIYSEVGAKLSLIRSQALSNQLKNAIRRELSSIEPIISGGCRYVGYWDTAHAKIDYVSDGTTQASGIVSAESSGGASSAATSSTCYQIAADELEAAWYRDEAEWWARQSSRASYSSLQSSSLPSREKKIVHLPDLSPVNLLSTKSKKMLLEDDYALLKSFERNTSGKSWNYFSDIYHLDRQYGELVQPSRLDTNTNKSGLSLHTGIDEKLTVIRMVRNGSYSGFPSYSGGIADIAIDLIDENFVTEKQAHVYIKGSPKYIFESEERLYIISTHEAHIAGLKFDYHDAMRRSENESVIQAIPLSWLLPKISINDEPVSFSEGCYGLDGGDSYSLNSLYTITAIDLKNYRLIDSVCINEKLSAYQAIGGNIYFHSSAKGTPRMSSIYKFQIGASDSQLFEYKGYLPIEGDYDAAAEGFIWEHSNALGVFVHDNVSSKFLQFDIHEENYDSAVLINELELPRASAIDFGEQSLMFVSNYDENILVNIDSTGGVREVSSEPLFDHAYRLSDKYLLSVGRIQEEVMVGFFYMANKDLNLLAKHRITFPDDIKSLSISSTAVIIDSSRGVLVFPYQERLVEGYRNGVVVSKFGDSSDFSVLGRFDFGETKNSHFSEIEFSNGDLVVNINDRISVYSWDSVVSRIVSEGVIKE